MLLSEIQISFHTLLSVVSTPSTTLAVFLVAWQPRMAAHGTDPTDTSLLLRINNFYRGPARAHAERCVNI